MKICDGENYIDIDFKCYDSEDKFPTMDLEDEKNCVMVVYGYDIRDHGWGVGGDEYFSTQDIVNVYRGLLDLVSGRTNRFFYEVCSRYAGQPKAAVFRYEVARKDENFAFEFTMTDFMAFPETVIELMSENRLRAVCEEYRQAVRRFPKR